MADIDSLRPEVRRANSFLDSMACSEDERAAVHTIRAELLRLAEYEQAAGRLAIEKAELRQCAEQCEAELAAMPDADEWHALRERAEHAEAELAALKARIAEAPWTTAQDTYIGHRYALVHYAMDERHCGKRVRLLVEE